MKPSQRAGWKRTHIANRLMVWITAIVAFATVCLAVAALFQYLTAREQNKTTAELLGAAREQANAAKRSADIAENQSQSVRDSAKAAKDSASAANTAIEQNKELIKAAQTQANTSQVSARAAEQSARLAAQSLFIGERPYFKITVEVTKIASGETPTAKIAFENVGRTPAHHFNVRSAIVLAARDRLPYDFRQRLNRQFDEGKGASATGGAEENFVPVGDRVYGSPVLPEPLSTRFMAAIEQRYITVHVYSWGTYWDGFGKKHPIEHCVFYDKDRPSFLRFCSHYNRPEQ